MALRRNGVLWSSRLEIPLENNINLAARNVSVAADC